jgi:hypothetical protein
MSKFEIKDGIDKVIFNFYNLIADFLFVFNFPARKLLKANRAYENKHDGERCFILGTGPSLNALTKSQANALGSEVIFGVNSLYKVEAAASIYPRYYALLDNLYWEQWSPTFAEVVEKYKQNPPIFITDLRARSLATRANEGAQHLLIYSKKYPINKMSEDLHKNIFAAMNVISYSIISAIYMGFKEVYLLGCDYNAFCTQGKGHAYDDKSEVNQSSYNLAFYLRFYWITTEFHYLISALAKRRGVHIINLTPNSLLDAYERKPVEQTLGL